MKRILLIILFILFALIFYSFLIYENYAPSFIANDLNKNLISNDNLKGKVVLINFWYPSCPACFKEIPQLNNLYSKYGKNSDFKLIGISANYNNLNQVDEYVRLRNIKFNIIYDKDNLILDAFEVHVMPMIFLINKKGHIYDFYIGEPNWIELEKNIQYLLNK